MIYVGTFSFDAIDPDGKPRHGYLSCTVAEKNPDSAADQFHRKITDLRGSGPPYDTMAAVYIEDIVEMPDIPEDALITWYQSSEGDFPKSITHSIPGSSRFGIGITAYGYHADVAEDDSSGRRYRESSPFITF